MSEEKKIVIYCSASYDIDPKYNQVAREATRAACSLGYTIVSGGAIKGTMGHVADEAEKCGARHIGVIPRFMHEYQYNGLDEIIWTETMDERKARLREGTVAALALPGGIGTLDEVIGTLTVSKLRKYDGKVIALNYEGFYEPLKALLDHYVTTKMMDQASRDLIAFPETVEELTAILEKL